MKDEKKTKKQLIDELLELRQRITNLEKSRARRKRAKKAPKESEIFYRTLVEAFPDAIILMDLNCNIIMVNEPGLKLFGYESAEEVIGKSALDFIAQKDLPRVLEDIKKMLEPGIVRNVEYTMIKKDGTFFSSELSSSLIVDERKKPKAFIGVARDITKSKQTEEALLDSRHMLQTVLDSIPSAVFWKDRDSIYLGGNRTWLEAVGLSSSEEVVGKSDYDLPWDKKQADSFRAYDRRVMQSGIPEYDIIEPYRRVDGTHAWAKTNKVPLRDKEGNIIGILGTYEDITEHKQAEEALIQAQRDWEEIFQAIGHPTLILDPEHNILLANRAAVISTGRTEEELKSKKCYEIFHGTDKPPENCPMEKMLSSGRLEVFEMEIEALGGFFLVSCTPVFDDKGNLQKIIHIATNITERKKAEKALLKSEYMFKETQKITKIGGWEYDVEGKKITWTDEVYRIYGVSPEDYDPNNIKQDIEFFAPKDRATIERAFYQAVREGKPYNLELNFSNAHGEHLWVRTIGQAEIKNGRVVRVFGNIMDITERKIIEEALRRSEEKYRQVVETATDIIFTTDTNGNFQFTNIAGLRLTGYTLEELQKLNYMDLVVPEYRRLTQFHYMRQFLKKIPSTYYEYPFKTRTGNVVWFGQTSSLLIEQDTVTGFHFISRDITERKRAEESLKRREQEFRLIAENVPALFSYIDADSCYRFVNKRYEAWFGIPQTKIIGKHIRQVLGETAYELIKESVEAALSGQKVYYEKSLPYLHGGERWVSANYVPDIDDVGKVKGFFALVTDITERKQAEEELRRSREQLRAYAARLQSVREEERTLVAREIHDELGQALTALKMDLSWLTKRLPENQKLLFEKTESMSELIDMTIKMMKRISTELRPGLLDDLGIAAAIEWQAEEFQNRTGITCEVKVDPADIISDKDRSTAIFRIFQETLTNISRHANATEVKASLMEKEGNLELKVTDNGKGITEEQISNPKSFGLIGIRERVYPYGGKVKIRGTPGKGTTVKVVIKL